MVTPRSLWSSPLPLPGSVPLTSAVAWLTDASWRFAHASTVMSAAPPSITERFILISPLPLLRSACLPVIAETATLVAKSDQRHQARLETSNRGKGVSPANHRRECERDRLRPPCRLPPSLLASENLFTSFTGPVYPPARTRGIRARRACSRSSRQGHRTSRPAECARRRA